MPEVSKPDQAEVTAERWAGFDVLTAEPGEPAVAGARSRAAAFEATWAQRYRGAVACRTGDLDTPTTPLRVPREQHMRIRPTNLILVHRPGQRELRACDLLGLAVCWEHTWPGERG